MIENAVLTFTFNGEKYRMKLDSSQVKKVACRKTKKANLISDSKVKKLIRELGYNDFWVNVTHLNNELGEKNSRGIAHILEGLGYTDSFRVKRKGEYHYIRYAPFSATEEEILEQLKI